MTLTEKSLCKTLNLKISLVFLSASQCFDRSPAIIEKKYWKKINSLKIKKGNELANVSILSEYASTFLA